MFDYNAFFGSPLGLTILIVAIAGAGALLLVRMPGGGKVEKIVVLERQAASTDEAGGRSVLYLAPRKIRKANQNKEIKTPDKLEFTLDDEGLKMADTLTVSKKFVLRAGIYRMVGREGGNIVTFAKSLANTSELMYDNVDMTVIGARRTLVSLARLAGGAISENILYIILALMAGVPIGWVVYPYFNHVAPIIETCTRLTNGTVIPRGICPG